MGLHRGNRQVDPLRAVSVGWQSLGDSGCNRFTGTYTQKDDALIMGPLALGTAN